MVEERERVPHTAVGLLRDDVETVWVGVDALLLREVLEVLHDVVHLHTVEVKYLTTRENRGQNLVLLRGREDEFCVGGRLFERLQKGIERRCREHMHLIDDIHAVFADLGRYSHLVNQLTDVIDGVVGRGVEFVDVVGAVFVERPARLALVARLHILGEVEAVDGFGEDTATRRLAHATRPAKEVRLRELVVFDGVFEG